MLVSELMTREFTSVRTSATITDVAKTMKERRQRFVSIVEGDRVLGVICDRDIVTNIVAREIEASTCHVHILASTLKVTVAPSAEAVDAARVMVENGQQCLCVMDGGALVGLVSLDDLAKAPNATSVVSQ